MEETVRAFQDVAADLRLVMTMSHTDWDLKYIRDNLESVYSESDLEETYREHMGAQIATENIGNIIETDEFHAQAYLFDNILVFQFPRTRYECLLATYDWDQSFPIKDVAAAAEEVDL